MRLYDFLMQRQIPHTRLPHRTAYTANRLAQVLHVPGTFLPKRFGGESLIGNDTRVLEAIIEILDPAPPGQPPLRVGQRVRVGLGQ